MKYYSVTSTSVTMALKLIYNKHLTCGNTNEAVVN